MADRKLSDQAAPAAIPTAGRHRTRNTRREIRAAIFDVFGTVVDWRTGIAAIARPALAERGLDIDPVAFADAWRAEYQPSMQRIRSGARGYLPLDMLHRENLDRVLEAFGIGGVFDEPAREMLNAGWERLPAWPDSPPGIAAIRAAGPLVAPCSNGSIGLMSRLARFAGIEWDCILGADVARAYKPDPQAYRRSVAALGLLPEQVVMVAAHNDDLRAARAEGLQTAFVPRPMEHGDGQTTDLEPTENWDFLARDMVDLARRITG